MGKRAGVVLATKFGNERNHDGEFVGINGSPDYVRRAADDSLQRLGVGRGQRAAVAPDPLRSEVAEAASTAPGARETAAGGGRGGGGGGGGGGGAAAAVLFTQLEELIAQERGGLEIESLGRCLHLRLQRAGQLLPLELHVAERRGDEDAQPLVGGQDHTVTLEAAVRPIQRPAGAGR